MPAQPVPATTAIRRSRVGNVDTDRLMRRRAFLHDLCIVNGGRTLATRMDFAMRAAELTAIETALCDRGDLSPADRITTTN